MIFVPNLRARLRRLHAAWLRLAPGSRLNREGRGHVVDWAEARLYRCRITLTGENNRLEIGPGAMLWYVAVQLTGRDLFCRIGARTRLRGGTLVLTDQGSRLEIGDGTTMTGPVIVAQGGCAVSLGRDCMVAYGTDIRCSDGHTVLDAATGRRLNPAADVRIGHHVWLGIHSQILKGLTIADHAIVAARAVVTRPVAAGTIVAGNPARPVRSGVTWDRRRP
jgi:acetyltransferase-like isoleucine patch superfamily enzyme